MAATDPDRHRAVSAKGLYRVAVTGASGLVGSALVRLLTGGGHTVHRMVRSRPTAPTDILWDPARGQLDAASLEGVDAVVHLAGESIATRWTAQHKAMIRSSRVEGTRLLATTLASLRAKPKVLVSASATGIYGDRGNEVLDESSTPGADFLATVGREWEQAAEPARDAGIRVVYARFGVILSPKGGALAKMLPPFQLGAGGKIGSGRQWMSWIALDDVVGAIRFAIFTDFLTGPVNTVAPQPVTNEEFARTLGQVLHRPSFATVPEFVVKLMFGEMGRATILASQRVLPRRLKSAGFTFRHPELGEALRHEIEVARGD
jgi:uncharacterized protein (TIGR01777 family)